jgi:hypothetical protein
MNEPLEDMAERLSQDPGFFGHALGAYQARHGLTGAQLAAELGCDSAVVVVLRCCRRPGVNRPYRSLDDDLRELARRFGVSPEALGRVVTDET